MGNTWRVTKEEFLLMSILAGEGFKDVWGVSAFPSLPADKMEEGKRKKVNKNKKKREKRVEVRK